MASPVCIIVGYGPGVAHGIAQAFAAEGFQLALLSRHPDNHRELLDGLVAGGVRAQAFATDASQPASIQAAIALASSTLGEPEVLIYNASALRQGALGSVTSAELLADFGVIVGGALTAANAVLPGMKERGHGAVMFTGSYWGEVPTPAFAATSIAKAALHQMARIVALDLQDSGVRSFLLIIKGLVNRETTDNPKQIGAAFLNAYQRPIASGPNEFIFETQPQP